MDVDGLGLRLAKLERLLDAMQPNWRDESTWPKARATQEASLNEEAAESDLVVDEEQTKADRIALGYEPDPNAPAGGTSEEQPAPSEWTDPDGNVWTSTDGKLWITGDGGNGDSRQTFEGSLEELQIYLKAPE